MFEAAFAAVATPVDPGRDALLGAIAELEQLKCATEARQAELTATLASRDGEHDRRVVADVAVARRESPHRARQHVGLAKILPTEMPHTMAAFNEGQISEWRATLLARETGCLSLADRAHVDEALAADATALSRMGDQEIIGAVRRLTAELDPAAVVAHRRLAAAERRVTLRPAPDTMTYLTALVPVEQGVAAYAALVRAADSARAAGDLRGKGQVMADTLVQLVTGQTSADDVPVAVNLVISDQALIGDSDAAAHLDGHGPMPSDLARQWISRATRRTLRRLYATPATGQLVAMESRSRNFPKNLAMLVRFRDQTCTTPWCDAPVRHTDHIKAWSQGGRTSFVNAQGQCEACSLAKGAGVGRSGDPPPGQRPWALASRSEFYFLQHLLEVA